MKWKTLNQWLDAIEHVDSHELCVLGEELAKSFSRRGIAEKTGIYGHVIALIYDTNITNLASGLETASASSKIPLIKKIGRVEEDDILYEFYPKELIGTPQEFNLYYIQEYSKPKETAQGTINAYTCFFSNGGSHHLLPKTKTPMIQSVADFARYLQKNNIKAHITTTDENGYWIGVRNKKTV